MLQLSQNSAITRTRIRTKRLHPTQQLLYTLTNSPRNPKHRSQRHSPGIQTQWSTLHWTRVRSTSMHHLASNSSNSSWAACSQRTDTGRSARLLAAKLAMQADRRLAIIWEASMVEANLVSVIHPQFSTRSWSRLVGLWPVISIQSSDLLKPNRSQIWKSILVMARNLLNRKIKTRWLSLLNIPARCTFKKSLRRQRWRSMTYSLSLESNQINLWLQGLTLILKSDHYRRTWRRGIGVSMQIAWEEMLIWIIMMSLFKLKISSEWINHN